MTYHPHVGGAEIAIKEITDRLSPEVYEIHLVANRYATELPREEKIGNVFVHRIGFSRRGVTLSHTHRPLFYMVKILYVPLAAITAMRLHRKHAFDGVWSMMSYMAFPVVLMRFCGVRIPYVISLQEGDPFEHVFNRWYIRPFRGLLRYAFRHASGVQTISNFLATWAHKAGFAGKVEVIPNAVDYKHFSRTYSEEELRATRDELGKKDEDVFLVTTSRLVYKNAIDDVVRALKHLPSHVRLVVFGIGPDREKIEEIAKVDSTTARVHFMGEISHKDMPRYLKACDIFIRPSRSEGMGNSFIEAMAAGLPIIATQEGGIADFLFDKKKNPDTETTGWAVRPNDPEDIVRAVRDIMEHPDEVLRVVGCAKKLVESQYDWDIIARAMEERVFSTIDTSRGA